MKIRRKRKKSSKSIMKIKSLNDDYYVWTWKNEEGDERDVNTSLFCVAEPEFQRVGVPLEAPRWRHVVPHGPLRGQRLEQLPPPEPLQVDDVGLRRQGTVRRRLGPVEAPRGEEAHLCFSNSELERIFSNFRIFSTCFLTSRKLFSEHFKNIRFVGKREKEKRNKRKIAAETQENWEST